MPSVIRSLPDRVANQIAAGEVVERPASIVKELVENSLDAGAGAITVSIRNGGKSQIEVVDDGSGMGRDDAIMAFERHATSKINDVDDLRTITSLGFRGEALPSISSVSRFTLATCLSGPEGKMAGVEVMVEGGKLREVRVCAPIPGTRIVVRSLFYNVPARRKFLRSETVEGARCHEAVIRQALGRPTRGFKLIRDGKVVFDTRGNPGADGLEKRITALFGQGLASQLIPVKTKSGEMSLSGFISRPGTSRSGRNTQYLYINGRYVHDRLLAYAVAGAYRSLLPRGRFPAFFLNLAIPPERVDVNVSPTKTEVRFSDARTVIDLLKRGTLETLQNTRSAGMEQFSPAGVEFKSVPDSEALLDQAWKNSAKAPPGGVLEAPGMAIGLCQPVAEISPEIDRPAPVQATRRPPQETTAPMGNFDAEISDGFVVIGQVFTTFIMVEDGAHLLLLDQHTVHERVNYEKLTMKYRSERVETQELLFPVQMDLSRRDADLMKTSLGLFKRLGFILEEFGELCWNLRAVPALLLGKDYETIILDILDKSVRMERDTSFDAVAEPAINIMACRGAVKSGQKLDAMEMESLVRSLQQCQLPYTCPHGRPVAITLEKNDLYKGFLR